MVKIPHKPEVSFFFASFAPFAVNELELES